jgi:hypothetical protein
MTRTLAYLDPGSSGLILQMIGGGIAALAVTIKLYGRRILRLLGIGRRDAKAEATSPTDTH